MSETLTDEQMVTYLGFGDDPRGLAAVQKLPPEQRALFERMAGLEMEVNLWTEGLGPKPQGVLIDLATDRHMQKYTPKETP
jgi:hypothetical protein